jgi:hypothetical protein
LHSLWKKKKFIKKIDTQFSYKKILNEIQTRKKEIKQEKCPERNFCEN